MRPESESGQIGAGPRPSAVTRPIAVTQQQRFGKDEGVAINHHLWMPVPVSRRVLYWTCSFHTALVKEWESGNSHATQMKGTHGALNSQTIFLEHCSSPLSLCSGLFHLAKRPIGRRYPQPLCTSHHQRVMVTNEDLQMGDGAQASNAKL